MATIDSMMVSPVGLYSIYDRVACEHGPQLMACKNDAVAVRMFLGAMKTAANSDDYDLFQVGKWDPQTGFCTSIGNPRQVPIVVEGYVEDDQNGKA